MTAGPFCISFSGADLISVVIIYIVVFARLIKCSN